MVAVNVINSEFEFIGEKGNEYNEAPFALKVSNSIAAGDHAYDLICAYSYTAGLCTSQGLYYDLSDVEHLDFENTWTMIDGMPALKLFCEKGDLNFDGGFNGKDANVMKSLIVSGTEGHLYASVCLADLNSDGTIDAKDANLLKQMIIG